MGDGVLGKVRPPPAKTHYYDYIMAEGLYYYVPPVSQVPDMRSAVPTVD
jgi:hypothetical protein